MNFRRLIIHEQNRGKRKIGKIRWRSASTSVYVHSHLGNMEWNESTKAWIQTCAIHGCSRLACAILRTANEYFRHFRINPLTPTPSSCQITFIDGGPRIKARLHTSVSITFINRKLKNNLRLCEQTSRSKVISISVYRSVKIICWICRIRSNV